MNKKWIGISAVAIIGIGLVIGTMLSNQKKPMRRNKRGPGINAPEIKIVANRDIEAPIEISGILYAYNKIELYAEVSGVLEKTGKHFREGNRFNKGGILIKIDDRVYRNNLLAHKSNLLNQLTLLLPDLAIDFPESASRWETYLRTFDLGKPLDPLPEPDDEKLRYYIASRNIFNSFYNIKGMEATMDKYTIRAPFNGVVAQSNINPGTLVRVGQKLGEFTNTQLFELEAPVGLFDLKRIKTGQPVELETRDINGTFLGRIQRINSIIDRNSMTVKVYIQLSDSRLKEGMYLTGQTAGLPISNVISLPKDLLVENRYLYVIEDSRLKLRKIDILGEKGDQIFIRGLQDGTRILGEPWTDAREGLKVPERNPLPPDN